MPRLFRASIALVATAAFLACLAAAPIGVADDSWTCPEKGKVFMTGARPSTAAQLKSAPVFHAPGTPPKHVAYVPKVRSMYGNDKFGDCVTAEEAFAKSCWIAGVQPEIDIPEPTVIDWARQRGLLHGADLGNVCDLMAKEGFRVKEQLYNDGGKRLVDFRDESTLKAAIAMGPVKVAIPARGLPAGAGSRDGWHAQGGRGGGSDHCVALCGYGRADWLYGELGVPVPTGLKAETEGYLLYTWSTIGFVDYAWVKAYVTEAWLRVPTTIGEPPLSPPHPPGVGILARLLSWLRGAFFAILLGVAIYAVIVHFGWPTITAFLARFLPAWFPALTSPAPASPPATSPPAASPPAASPPSA